MAFRNKKTHTSSPREHLPGSPPVVISSAALVDMGTVGKASKKTEWQQQAWSYYDDVSELRYGVGWLANALSRSRLYVGKTDPENQARPSPVRSGAPLVPLEELFEGTSGHGQMLSRMATHLSVPGETYLIGMDHKGKRRWLCSSNEEFETTRQGKTKVRLPESDQQVEITLGSSTVLRLWRPHPKRAFYSDSPVLGLRSALRELTGTSAHISATLNSRLAGAGVWPIPESASFPQPAESENVNPVHSDPAMNALIQAMVTPLSNPDSAAAIVPLLMRVSDDALKNLKDPIKFHTPLDDKIVSIRDSALRRLAIGLDVPPEVVLGSADLNHWCVDDSTEIFTRDGWRSHDQLSSGDVVLTLNHDTGASEWQPVGQVKRWQVEDLDMVAMEGRYHSSLSTLNHRWPVLRGKHASRRDRVFTTSENLQQDDFLVTAAPCSDVPTEAKYADAFAELVGWFFTEGSCRRREGRDCPQVCINQSMDANPENISRIKACLTSLYGPPAAGPLGSGGRKSTPESQARREEARRLWAQDPRPSKQEIGRRLGVSATMVAKYLTKDASTHDSTPRWRVVYRDNGMVTFLLNRAAAQPLVDVAPDRAVSLDFVRSLTAGQLELFINAAIRGDGSTQAGGTRWISQKQLEMTEAFELAVILSGRSVHSYPSQHHGYRTHVQHVVSMREKGVFGPRHRNTSRRKYTGTIWCPTTPNRTWLARRNGKVYFTGNTAWQVEESAIKLHIAPLLGLICNALTEQYLRPALTALKVKDASRYVIWYDTSDIQMRPNRAPESIQLWDRGLLSDDSTLHEHGFSEEDKPGEDERLRHLAVTLVTKNAALAPYLLPYLGLESTVPAGAAGGGGGGEGSEVERADGGGDPQDEPSRPRALPAADADEAPGNVRSSAAQWRLNCLEVSVVRALERAGNWLLNRNRSARGRMSEVPLHEIHAHLPVPDRQLDQMLSGAYRELVTALPEETCLHATVDEYVRALLVSGQPHERRYLSLALLRSGCVTDAA
ncbi:hypothetical protein [Streptomyces sp. TR02-1]|uniref:hypothetical protein n=1 Tax=Streptomyces sp. TR02-1 TaxID=3385977 RepID=UPI00399FA9FC